MNVHKNARLTQQGRVLMVRRIIDEGWRVAAMAATAVTAATSRTRPIRPTPRRGVAGAAGAVAAGPAEA
jgi:hypothetical protein